MPQAQKRDEIAGAYDGVLMAVVLTLVGIGVVMVASSSLAISEGHGVEPLHYLHRHLFFLAVGLIGAVFLMRTELRALERRGSSLLILAFVLLTAVLVPGLGREVNGATRWIELRFFGFQAVEAAKLLLILWLASYMVRYREQLQDRFWGVFKPLAVVAMLGALLLAQPDFGSTVLLCAITGGMLWLGGARAPFLLAPALLGAVGLAALAVFEPYRMRRLVSFLDPFQDPYGAGYQLSHSLIAIGRGEATGVGLGASVQKLFYLPEAHTDFIFAVYAEETGFIGVSLLIGLFVLLAARAFWLGLRAIEMGRAFAGYCAFGVALWMSLQSLVSIGVNMGVLPTKGLTLPLISSGGSSVILSCMALGLLLRVSYEAERARRQAGKLRSEDLQDPAELLQRPASAAPNRAEAPSPVFRPGPARARIEPGIGALP
ncbi:MAG: putative lipid II flippase FtsW [Xanthomonadales bacterium]|nr:putative lipid II flippase FtsW [Xanthomonadales bacterium]